MIKKTIYETIHKHTQQNGAFDPQKFGRIRQEHSPDAAGHFS
jgi:hypothetical protein